MALPLAHSLAGPLRDPTVNTDTPTVAEFVEHWLGTYCQPPYKAAYLGRNRRTAAYLYLVPTLGTLPLAQVTTADLARTQRELFAKGLAVSSVKTTFGYFAEMWKAAKSEGLVRGRPASDLVWPKKRKRKPTVFTEDEGRAIVEEFARRRSWALPQVAVMFLAGTRPSEAAGLRWCDLNPRTGELAITRAIACKEETGGKTRKSVRKIAVGQELIQLLVRHRRPGTPDDALMSINSLGLGVDTESFSQAHFRPVVREMGLKYRSIYAARHSFITWMLMDGASAAWVAEYCATSIREIEESYLSWIGTIQAPAKRGPVGFAGSYGVADMRHAVLR